MPIPTSPPPGPAVRPSASPAPSTSQRRRRKRGTGAGGSSGNVDGNRPDRRSDVPVNGAGPDLSAGDRGSHEAVDGAHGKRTRRARGGREKSGARGEAMDAAMLETR